MISMGNGSGLRFCCAAGAGCMPGQLAEGLLALNGDGSRELPGTEEGQTGPGNGEEWLCAEYADTSAGKG